MVRSALAESPSRLKRVPWRLSWTLGGKISADRPIVERRAQTFPLTGSWVARGTNGWRYVAGGPSCQRSCNWGPPVVA